MVQLLTADATLAMPPIRAWFMGPDEIGEYFSTGPLDGDFHRIRLVRVRANHQPAVVAYLPAADGRFDGYGAMVFDLEGDRIQGITGLAESRLVAAFGLPSHMPS